VPFDTHANLIRSTIVTPPSPATTGTTLEVGPSDPIVGEAPPFNCTAWPSSAAFPTHDNAEIVRVTGISSTLDTTAQPFFAIDSNGFSNEPFLILVGFNQFVTMSFRVQTSIPQGVAVTQAMMFVWEEVSLGAYSADCTVWGDDGTGPTAATVQFNYTGFSGYNQLDITPIVQELVNRSSWTGTFTITFNDNGTSLLGFDVINAGPTYIQITATNPVPVLTIQRHQEGTSAIPLAAGDNLALTITKKVITDIEDRISQQGWPIFSIPDFAPAGHVFGVGDDAAYVQAAVDAAAAVGRGTIFWPHGCLTKIRTCINLPARGTYRFTVDPGGMADSVYLYNANPAYSSGIVVDTGIAGMPAGWQAGLDIVFNSWNATNAGPGAQGELNLVFDGIMLYNSTGSLKVGLVTICGNVNQWAVRNCITTAAGLVYKFSPAGMGQDYLGIIEGNQGSGWMLYAPQGGPFIGVIAHNTWYATGDVLNPMPIGEVIDQQDFWIWSCHHNVFQTANNTVAGNRAMIAVHNIVETILGQIDHNAFYGATGACIYWKDDAATTVNNASGGITIDYNQFVGWNQAGRDETQWASAALVIDASTGSPPDQQINIGPNTFSGGAQIGSATGAHFGIWLIGTTDPAPPVGDPPNATNYPRGVMVSPFQMFRQCQTANILIDDGGAMGGSAQWVPARMGQIECSNLFMAGTLQAQFGILVGGSHFSGSGSVSDVSAAGAAQDLYFGYSAGSGKHHFFSSADGTTVLDLDAHLMRVGFFGHATVAQATGWGAPTGTATRTTFATGSVTLSQLAERVKALIDDLTSYGLLHS
jgi:hypothetical protein